jgi:AraC-like DNA-binding protein
LADDDSRQVNRYLASVLPTKVNHREVGETIRAGALRGLDSFLGASGIRLSTLCERVGIEPSDLVDPESRMPVSRFVELLELAAQRSNDDVLGLHLCSRQPLSSLGEVADIFLRAPDILTAIRSGTECMPLHQEGALLELTIEGRFAICAYRVRSPFLVDCRQNTEMAVARMLRFARAITHRADFVPSAVYFEHPAPRDVSEHRRVFGAPVYFSQPCSGLVFPRELLYRPTGRNGGDTLRRVPLRATVPVMEPSARTVPSRTSALRADALDLRTALRSYITRAIRQGRASIIDCAGAFGWHVRTLQRRLAAEGTTFDQLLEATRYELALHYLKQTHLSLTEIAELLGYAELSTFSRAFRRWSGRSPLAHRRGRSDPGAA